MQEQIKQQEEDALVVLRAAEKAKIRGEAVSMAKLNKRYKRSHGSTIIQDVASNTGIPDFVELIGVDPGTYWEQFIHPERGAGERPVTDSKEIALRDAASKEKAIVNLIKNPEKKGCVFNVTPPADITPIKIPTSTRAGQVLSGSCNAREEETVKTASMLCCLSFSAFVTKATLYMARFIMRRRRNDKGHPYTPGEAYLFMEHGKAMQDAFTPDEVKLAMKKAGISGSEIADDLMAELERLRDKRMNPEA